MATVDSLESMWTYHEEVRLVIVKYTTDHCYLIEDDEDEGWMTGVTKTDGILTDRRSGRKQGKVISCR